MAIQSIRRLTSELSYALKIRSRPSPTPLPSVLYVTGRSLILPAELILEIASYLDLHDIFHLAQASSVLRQLLLREWRTIVPLMPPEIRLQFWHGVAQPWPEVYACGVCFHLHIFDMRERRDSRSLRTARNKLTHGKKDTWVPCPKYMSRRQRSKPAIAFCRQDLYPDNMEALLHCTKECHIQLGLKLVRLGTTTKHQRGYLERLLSPRSMRDATRGTIVHATPRINTGSFLVEFAYSFQAGGRDPGSLFSYFMGPQLQRRICNDLYAGHHLKFEKRTPAKGYITGGCESCALDFECGYVPGAASKVGGDRFELFWLTVWVDFGGAVAPKPHDPSIRNVRDGIIQARTDKRPRSVRDRFGGDCIDGEKWLSHGKSTLPRRRDEVVITERGGPLQ